MRTSPLISFGKSAQGRLVSPGRPISYPRNSYAKPKASVAPAITGTTTVGSVLTCDGGTWIGSVTVTFRWISGNVDTGIATPTYTILAGDVGKTISCRVIAAAASGLATGYQVGVYVPNIAPVNSVAPVIAGSTPAGSVLSVSSTGTWTGGNITSFGYQWQRNGVNVAGATLPQYKTNAASIGLPVRCVITAINADFSTPANSNAITVT